MIYDYIYMSVMSIQQNYLSLTILARYCRSLCMFGILARRARSCNNFVRFCIDEKRNSNVVQSIRTQMCLGEYLYFHTQSVCFQNVQFYTQGAQ
jgi:hypothetical protein